MSDSYSDDDFYSPSVNDDDHYPVSIEAPMRALALASTDTGGRLTAQGVHSVRRQQPSGTVAVPAGIVSTSSSTQEEVLARITALEKALYKSQQERDALKARNTELEEERMTTSDEKRRQRRGKGSSVSSTPAQTDGSVPVPLTMANPVQRSQKPPEEARVTIAGKNAERPDIDPLDFHQRYRNDESEELALIAEAWDVISAEPLLLPRLRSGLDPKLIEAFSTAVSYEKSKFVNASNQNIHLLFEDLQLPLSSFKTLEARRNCATLRALGPEDADDFYCRVLFPLKLKDSSLEDAGHLLFRSERIIMVLQGALFGVSAIGSNTRKASNVKANLWRVREVTPASRQRGSCYMELYAFFRDLPQDAHREPSLRRCTRTPSMGE
ncbi:hypothetical protein BDY19DRAFT_536966 [Irpex rosettiformis]|uniref:Uncharacterized protein n=1 Tax=Irpex rosettiformis TaxID=378272 RepID=A0ACB8TR31_9APHY|nr:hypothetical protein BDY19DRAFT_536966 [Irpex rosettiformis]